VSSLSPFFLSTTTSIPAKTPSLTSLTTHITPQHTIIIITTTKVAAMVGDDSFSIKPRIGEYLLLKRPAITAKEEPPLCRHIVFPCPGPMGKGILVQPTLWY